MVVWKNLVTEVGIKTFSRNFKKCSADILKTPQLKGVILNLRSGNAPTDSWFIEELSKAIRKTIINVTQCTSGLVLMGHYQTSTHLRKIGVVGAKDMTTESAIAKMMHLLGKGLKKDMFIQYFQKSLRGEI